MSTVRLEEKLADRRKLLEDVRDQSVGNNEVDGANCLYTPGRSSSAIGKISGPLDPPIEELSDAFRNSSLTAPLHTPQGLRNWDHSSPLNQMNRNSFNTGNRSYTDHLDLSPNQAKHQENLRQMIQSNMSRINRSHLEVNETKAKRGLDVSVDDIDVELYRSQNLIASTDPSMLSNNYSERIKILTNINENLELNLDKKKRLLAVLSQTDTKTTASNSEPR